MLIGAFALGHAAPNVETINVARGAALRVFQIIDRVSVRQQSALSIYYTLYMMC